MTCSTALLFGSRIKHSPGPVGLGVILELQGIAAYENLGRAGIYRDDFFAHDFDFFHEQYIRFAFIFHEKLKKVQTYGKAIDVSGNLCYFAQQKVY